MGRVTKPISSVPLILHIFSLLCILAAVTSDKYDYGREVIWKQKQKFHNG